MSDQGDQVVSSWRDRNQGITFDELVELVDLADEIRQAQTDTAKSEAWERYVARVVELQSKVLAVEAKAAVDTLKKGVDRAVEGISEAIETLKKGGKS